MLMSNVCDYWFFVFSLFLDHFAYDILIPVGSDSVADHLEGFTERHAAVLSFQDVGVEWIKARVLLAFELYEWRRVVVGLPPEFDLVHAVNPGSLMFAEAFE